MPSWAKLIIAIAVPLVAASCQAQSYQPSYQQRQVIVSDEELSRAQLDQILAPIALYPDTVLSHVLIASTYPLEVVQASRWAQNNSHLSAEQAVDAAEHKTWDPSVRALVAFPQILERMSEDLEWTTQLGDAFLLDEALVMDAIQNLREKAYAAGSLKEMKHVSVQREQEVIIIEPAVERVVYIPYYDPSVVYGNWWWPHHPPTYWRYSRDHAYVNGFYWGPRAYLGSSFFFTSFHWHQRQVVFIDYRQHRHPRVYSGRHISRFDGARRWQHNPVHRRGVSYRNQSLREHYSGSRRTSPRQLQHQREGTRRFEATKSRPNGWQDRREQIQPDKAQRAESLRDRLSRSRSTQSGAQREAVNVKRREMQVAPETSPREPVERKAVPQRPLNRSDSETRTTVNRPRTTTFERRRESLQERRSQPAVRDRTPSQQDRSPARVRDQSPARVAPGRANNDGASRRESLRDHLRQR